jgi:hypothetical protein
MNPFKEKFKNISRDNYIKYLVAIKGILKKIQETKFKLYDYPITQMRDEIRTHGILKAPSKDDKLNHPGVPYIFLFEDISSTAIQYLKYSKTDPQVWDKLYDYGAEKVRDDLIILSKLSPDDIEEIEDEINKYNREKIALAAEENERFKLEKKISDFQKHLDKMDQLSGFSVKLKIETIKKELDKQFKTVLEADDTIKQLSTFDYKSQIANFSLHASIECNVKYFAHLESLLKETEKSDSPEIQSFKIKVNLTVPQIAYLFRALDKVGILDVKNKMDLFKSISEIFQTTGKEEPSVKNIKNKFYTPDDFAINFWDEKFSHLKHFAYNEK